MSGEDREDPAAIASLLRTRAAGGGLAIATVGSSMEPTIAGGAEVRLAATDRPRRGEIWCYVGRDGRVVVHRVRSVGDEAVLMRGDANRSNDERVPTAWLVGRVTGVVGGRRFGPVDRLEALARQARGALRRRLRRR